MVERRVVHLKRGPDGLFIEPEPTASNAVMIAHNQERAVTHFNYADEFCGNGNTYDPKGNYNCGRCNQIQRAACLLLDIDKVDPKAGSCEDWESQRAGDPELDMHKKDPAVANYAVAKNGVGYGCHRCPYQKKAKHKDSQGRDRWCGELAFYVMWNGCCTNNGVETEGDYDSYTDGGIPNGD